jgi:hypothetical protein
MVSSPPRRSKRTLRTFIQTERERKRVSEEYLATNCTLLSPPSTAVHPLVASSSQANPYRITSGPGPDPDSVSSPRYHQRKPKIPRKIKTQKNLYAQPKINESTSENPQYHTILYKHVCNLFHLRFRRFLLFCAASLSVSRSLSLALGPSAQDPAATGTARPGGIYVYLYVLVYSVYIPNSGFRITSTRRAQQMGA